MYIHEYLQIDLKNEWMQRMANDIIDGLNGYICRHVKESDTIDNSTINNIFTKRIVHI